VAEALRHPRMDVAKAAKVMGSMVLKWRHDGSWPSLPFTACPEGVVRGRRRERGLHADADGRAQPHLGRLTRHAKVIKSSLWQDR
jgi:hypothetical protein